MNHNLYQQKRDEILAMIPIERDPYYLKSQQEAFDELVLELLGEDEDVAQAIRVGSDTWAVQRLNRNALRAEQRAIVKGGV